MNKKTYILALAAATLVLGSCDNCDSEAETRAARQINLLPTISSPSRVIGNADGSETFEEGDQFSVFAWTGSRTDVPAAEERVVDNAIVTLTGGQWVATPQMLWRDKVTPHHFVAVHPTLSNGNDLTSLDYTLRAGDQAASDLLVAVNQGLVASDGAVPLLFTHVMSKVVVNLSYRNQWNSAPTVKQVVLNNAANGATVNALTKTVTATEATRTAITLPMLTANTQYGSIVIPQSGVREVAITIDGRAYTFESADDIQLESGKITTVNLTVGRDKLELGGVTIAPWSNGQTIDGGEAQE